MANVTVVVGAQFGSEGKGAVCGYLGKKMKERDVAIRVAGPNAGHTVIGVNGETWKLRCLPVAAVTSSVCQLHIAAGSEIDLQVLMSELAALDEQGYQVSDRLTVHPSATILTSRHQAIEGASGLIGMVGSTGKGIGAARAARAMRNCDTAESVNWLGPMLSEPGVFDLEASSKIVVEGTQGYGLGLHTPFYPQVTSSDCRAVDFLGMAGISPWDSTIREFKVILVARVYPIRVAGNSGPLKNETTWAELGLDEERTTVTNNIRRVGQWDSQLVREALRANGGGDYHSDVTVAITMIDHLFPEVHGKTQLSDAAVAWIEEAEDELNSHITLVGTGPNTVVEM